MREIDEGIAVAALSGNPEARLFVERLCDERVRRNVRSWRPLEEPELDTVLKAVWSFVWEHGCIDPPRPPLRFHDWVDLQVRGYLAKHSPRRDEARREPSSAEFENGDMLVLRAQGDDADAIRELVERHTPWVIASVCWRGVPTRDSEDVAQLILYDAMRGLRGFKVGKGSSFRKWLATIVWHRAIDYFRKQGRSVRVTSLDVDLRDDGPSIADGNVSAGNPSASSIAFYQVLGAMENDERDVFVAFHHDKLDVSTIAQNMTKSSGREMSDQKVYALLRKAKARIERAMLSTSDDDLRDARLPKGKRR